MKLMRITLLLLLCCSAFISCTNVNVALKRNTSNTNSIGLVCTYPEKFQQGLKMSTDSTIKAAIDKFNLSEASYKIHETVPGDTDLITVEFRHGALVKSKGRAAVNLALMILVGSIVKSFTGYSIVPPIGGTAHGLSARVYLSSSLSTNASNYKKLRAISDAVFGKREKQIFKLHSKFEKKLLKVFNEADRQLKVHGKIQASAVRPG